MPETPLYLDTAATTPLRPEVRDAMLPFLDGVFGNPSSPHRFGRAARVAVDRARRILAERLGVPPGAVYFTSGGTEANNIAILGTALAARDRGQPARVAVAAVEHKSVLAAADALHKLGGEGVVLPVDGRGQVDRERTLAALDEGLALVSVGLVNNETGIAADLAWLADACRERSIPLHTDAVQAAGKVDIAGGWDLLTVSAHKLGGPKGAGALVLARKLELAPITHGGGQERGIRPGTESVPAIVGFGVAFELAMGERNACAAQLASLQHTFEARLLSDLDDVLVHGAETARAPHITSAAFAGTSNERLLTQLDLAGVAASTGSACTTGSVTPSHVLTAMGVAPNAAASSLRFSFGRHLTPEAVHQAASVVVDCVGKLRQASQVGRHG